MLSRHDLNFKQKLTYTAHLFKALTRQRFLELKPMLQQHIREDSIVVDVGAHAGEFTKLFSTLAPQGRIYSFEPGSYARSILTRVVSVRGLRNVSIQPVGLGDKASSEILHMPLKQSGSIGFGLSHLGNDKNVDGRETVEEKINLVTLDDFVAQNGLTRLDFIKIDVEGWELRALEGGAKTIEKFHPVLMLEMVDKFLQRAGDSSRKLWDFLKSQGYDIYRYDENGRTDFLEAPVEMGDVICIRK